MKPTADSVDAQQSVGVGVLGWLGIDGSWEDLGGSFSLSKPEENGKLTIANPYRMLYKIIYICMYVCVL